MVGGLIHYQLWQSGYRGIPYIGPMFIANMVASAAVALLILFRNDVKVVLAGMILSVGSLVALVLSRTVGLLGFTERAWTVQAVRATTAEFGAIVAFAVILVGFSQRRTTLALIPARIRRTDR